MISVDSVSGPPSSPLPKLPARERRYQPAELKPGDHPLPPGEVKPNGTTLTKLAFEQIIFMKFVFCVVPDLEAKIVIILLKIAK